MSVRKHIRYVDFWGQSKEGRSIDWPLCGRESTVIETSLVKNHKDITCHSCLDIIERYTGYKHKEKSFEF